MTNVKLTEEDILIGEAVGIDYFELKIKKDPSWSIKSTELKQQILENQDKLEKIKEFTENDILAKFTGKGDLTIMSRYDVYNKLKEILK